MIPIHPQTDAGRRLRTPSEEVAAEDRPTSQARPWVYTNMIASADGATALDGSSGALGGPADVEMLVAFRGIADVILVGSATVTQEGYRPPQPPPEIAAARAARGQQERPLIAVVTGRASLGLDLPLFTDPGYRPLVITSQAAPADRVAELATVADVYITPTPDKPSSVDLTTALGELSRRGHQLILSEGGPTLNAGLVTNDLIDEWNLTISPMLVGGNAKRAAQGSEPLTAARPMNLTRVWLTDDGLMFCRWVRPSRRGV